MSVGLDVISGSAVRDNLILKEPPQSISVTFSSLFEFVPVVYKFISCEKFSIWCYWGQNKCSASLIRFRHKQLIVV